MHRAPSKAQAAWSCRAIDVGSASACTLLAQLAGDAPSSALPLASSAV